MTVRNPFFLLACLPHIYHGQRGSALCEHLRFQEFAESHRPQIAVHAAANPLQVVAKLILVLDQLAAFDIAGTGARFPARNPSVIGLRPSAIPAVMQVDGDNGAGDKIIDGNVQADGTWQTLSKEEEEEAMNERLKAGKMTFDDYLHQVDMINTKPSENMKAKDKAALEGSKARTVHYPAYVKAMLPEEREEPQLLVEEFHGLQRAGYGGGNRMARIAQDTGKTVQDVFTFVAEYEMMRNSIAKLLGGASTESIVQDIKAGGAESGYFPKDMNREARRAAKKRVRTRAKKGFQ